MRSYFTTFTTLLRFIWIILFTDDRLCMFFYIIVYNRLGLFTCGYKKQMLLSYIRNVDDENMSSKIENF